MCLQIASKMHQISYTCVAVFVAAYAYTVYMLANRSCMLARTSRWHRAVPYGNSNPIQHVGATVHSTGLCMPRYIKQQSLLPPAAPDLDRGVPLPLEPSELPLPLDGTGAG